MYFFTLTHCFYLVQITFKDKAVNYCEKQHWHSQHRVYEERQGHGYSLQPMLGEVKTVDDQGGQQVKGR